ncbi:(2Fe-2S)-binding protein [Pseudonocardia spinosispora]|uniref:(2Fe-2S)-binding protein n=1 Tax=Pseudonocardia spinosispora TaxID=103441 RepID=UPI0012EC5593|nr:(2Fe-2S)-binding protein [Pseudonocardia spinosispora]
MTQIDSSTADETGTEHRMLRLTVNGDPAALVVTPYESLNSVLRDRLNLTGTKRGCDTGGCGTCTVQVDGQAIYSCMYPALRAEGRSVRTVEGLGRDGEHHPLQTALVEGGGVQCGYCTPGVLMASCALYAENPDTDADDLAEELAGNLCRCTGYVKLIEALAGAGEQMRRDGHV